MVTFILFVNADRFYFTNISTIQGVSILQSAQLPKEGAEESNKIHLTSVRPKGQKAAESLKTPNNVLTPNKRAPNNPFGGLSIERSFFVGMKSDTVFLSALQPCGHFLAKNGNSTAVFTMK